MRKSQAPRPANTGLVNVHKKSLGLKWSCLEGCLYSFIGSFSSFPIVPICNHRAELQCDARIANPTSAFRGFFRRDYPTSTKNYNNAIPNRIMAKFIVPGHTFSSHPGFRYEPLDLCPTRPSIRLAVLQPGTRDSTVRITLAPTTFADRPRYEALSYTWGSPDVVKGVEINEHRFNVRENLWAALLQLRSPTQARALWIDAICINQDDTEERNHQVKLMAHIYARAAKVLVWLGAKVPVDQGTVFPDMSSTETRNICIQSYWKRIWIVQEIGAASELEVYWASRSLPWDDFFGEMKRWDPANLDVPMRLSRHRKDRHGDAFLLANLIETYKDSLCEEPRDKIYGFVGIAHDCQDGTFPMDYSKPLFEIYEDAITFQCSLTKMKRNPFKEKEVSLSTEEIADRNTFEKRFSASYASRDQKMLLKQRMKTALHFSQLVQGVWGGGTRIRQDYSSRRPDFIQQYGKDDPFFPPLETLSLEEFNPFRITGVHSGSISRIGPSYDELIAIPDAARKWKAGLSDSHEVIEKLRRKNEGFMKVLLSLSKADLSKIVSVDPHFSWKRQADAPSRPKETFTAREELRRKEFDELPKFILGPTEPIYPDSSDDEGFAEPVTNVPRLFLTKTGVIGLMPPNVRQWDMVYQFWHSDSVAIIRKEGDYLRIVGRAVVANDSFIEGSKFHEPEHHFNGFDVDKDGKEVYMDLRTLQLMTQ